MKRIVLAYSGGLDTSVILAWLAETYGCEVIAFIANLGQGEELERVRQKAIDIGATDVHVEDLQEEFARDYVFPVLRANAVYEQGYLLGSAVGRALIAARQVAVARQVGADALAHGATGKGNDQIRFELVYRTLAPDLRVVTPWRQWDFRTRSDLLDFAERRGIPIDQTGRSEAPYSVDTNLYNTTFEGQVLEDPDQRPPAGISFRVRDLPDTPDEAEQITITFAGGDPTGVNGRRCSPAEILQTLNDIGSRHGLGRVDMVENRIIGIKTRGVYETPGGTILLASRRELEALVLDQEVAALRRELMPRYARLVYKGLWFAPERQMLQAALDWSRDVVEGVVTLEIYKGHATVLGRSSPASRYSINRVSFEAETAYRREAPEGFIEITALRLAQDRSSSIGRVDGKEIHR